MASSCSSAGTDRRTHAFVTACAAHPEMFWFGLKDSCLPSSTTAWTQQRLKMKCTFNPCDLRYQVKVMVAWCRLGGLHECPL